MSIAESRSFFDRLNRDYLAVHRAKEELFWATRMALSDDHAGFARAETAYKAFVSDPARLRAVLERLSGLESAGEPRDRRERDERRELLEGLRGWRAFFEANVVEGSSGPGDLARVIGLEAELFAKRRGLALCHLGESGAEEPATLGTLATNLAANPSEAARASSLRALRGLEAWVLENGFLEIVKARNAFARGQGREDFFDYKSSRPGAMGREELFGVLDEFERLTSDANARGLRALERSFGPEALEPWNIRFRMGGDVARDLDPYFPFERALERWVQGFRRMGVSFRRATLGLDLLEREGKYQNGFCHAPVPAFYDRGAWVPARVNFTSDGRPGQVGSGQRALRTLFHEGGHAAHFANVARNSPCFSQEFAPTSMAYAETQSMFFDSVLGDADWLSRYARRADGSPVPEALVLRRIERSQPYRAYDARALLAVPYFERELYALGDSELEPGRVLGLARETERRILGAESPRPLLAIPHLLDQESAASYQGYLLAEMAVYQTRAWFLDEYGFIADNPEVGRLLAEKYWAPGNSATHAETLKALTGEGFSARYLAEACGASVEEACAAAANSMASAAVRVYPADFGPGLDAEIRVAHGELAYADNSVSEERMCEDFASWVGSRYPRS